MARSYRIFLFCRFFFLKSCNWHTVLSAFFVTFSSQNGRARASRGRRKREKRGRENACREEHNWHTDFDFSRKTVAVPIDNRTQMIDFSMCKNYFFCMRAEFSSNWLCDFLVSWKGVWNGSRGRQVGLHMRRGRYTKSFPIAFRCFSCLVR